MIMSDNQQKYPRGYLGLPTSATPTTTTGYGAPMSTAATGISTSQVATSPLSNAAVFAHSPQLLQNTAGTAVVSPHLPFSFVSPTGQIFLSSLVPLSPSLPFIGNTGFVPHPQTNPMQLTGLTLPFGLPSTISLPSSAPQSSTLSVSSIADSPTSPLLAPESTTTMITSQAQMSKTVSTIDGGQPSSVKTLPLVQSPPSDSTRSSVQLPYTTLSLQRAPSLQTDQSSPASSSSSHHQAPYLEDPHKQRTQSKEHATRNPASGSLKKLLVSPKECPSSHDLLKEQLAGENDLILFYHCFLSSPQSQHLHIEVLPSQGNLKWLQVRQKVFHIDRELGPVVVARILVSSNAIVKLQLLFPVYKTIFTKLFVEQEMEDLLSELSLNHVICPGLPNYADKFSVLGYHPSHVRIFESTHMKRYDHEHCPIWHVPTGTFSKRDRTAQKMCKQCKYLQNSVVRLATKACEVDPAERESWTNPSSNRPLAYMSAADREERYRKLRQERNQMLVKLRAYEERLGIGEKEMAPVFSFFLYCFVSLRFSLSLLHLWG
ncbi:hypothetical protein GBAR_LOCUS18630 [Geodia barretti]|uniref:Uncharacterized protein n=1 Tax=Geodia barretti TaxID=519541 RepID=A0AA35SMV3_GEOBA|nr:hypothetical protein GBAR_LOCUS18630 [Geodia barretti]